MRKILLGAAVAGLAFTTSQAQAQSANERASYRALHATPIGALAPLAPNVGRQSTAWRAHYGRHDVFGTGSHTFALGADFPAGLRSSFGFTAGWRNIEAGGGDHFMVGTHLSGNLMGGIPAGMPDPETARLAIGYNAQLGYARNNGNDFLAASASMPLSVPVASGQTRFVPFLSPGLGWGRLSPDNADARSSLRAMLGGGLGLEVAGGTGIHLGAQRIFVDGGDIQYGLGVTLRPR